MNDVNALIAKYCETHSIKKFPWYASGFSVWRCYCCGEPWNVTYQKIKPCKELPKGTVICSSCYTRVLKVKGDGETLGMVLKRHHYSFQEPNPEDIYRNLTNVKLTPVHHQQDRLEALP